MKTLFIILVFSICSYGLTLAEDLGKKLFFDPRLSGNNAISCASCHNPMLGWSDGLPKSIGFNGKILARRTPTIIDSKFQMRLFWDGRAHILEEQALGPIESPDEMNQNLNDLVAELEQIKGYQDLFKNAFADGVISLNNIASALAEFQRTIIHTKSEFEKYLAKEPNTVSEAALRGQKIFNSPRARCFACHRGAALSDSKFWDIGLNTEDRGRGPFELDNKFAEFAFKTPTLWGVASRGPYFHDGSAKTLADVVEHYNKGGVVFRDSLAPQIGALGLTDQEKLDLIAFLKSLNGNEVPFELPMLPK